MGEGRGRACCGKGEVGLFVRGAGPLQKGAGLWEWAGMGLLWEGSEKGAGLL